MRWVVTWYSTEYLEQYVYGPFVSSLDAHKYLVGLMLDLADARDVVTEFPADFFAHIQDENWLAAADLGANSYVFEMDTLHVIDLPEESPNPDDWDWPTKEQLQMWMLASKDQE